MVTIRGKSVTLTEVKHVFFILLLNLKSVKPHKQTKQLRKRHLYTKLLFKGLD